MCASCPTPAWLQSNDTNSEALFCHCVPPSYRRSVSTAAVVSRFVYGARRSAIRSAAGRVKRVDGSGMVAAIRGNGIEMNSLGLTIPFQSRGAPYICGHLDFLYRDKDDHQDVRVACNPGGPPNSYR